MILYAFDSTVDLSNHKAYAHLDHVADSNAPTGLGFRKAKKCQDYSLKNHEEPYAADEY